MSLHESSLVAEGDKVAAEAVSYGKLASGRVYNNYYHFLIVVRDGKIARLNEYMDTYHAKDIFGL